MQKLCEVCKRPYPDTEKACPHCAASKARPGSDADIDLGPALAAAGTGDSSAVVVELAEEDEAAPAAPRAAVPPGSEADIDLGPAAGAGGPGDSGVAVVELAEEEAAPAGSPSDSVVDLGKALAQQSGQAPAAEPSPSDASMEAWAALAEESPAAGAGEVRLDSPSDADLLRHAREEAPAAPPPEKPAPAQPAASEEVPLAESGGPPSGVSNVAWVALVEEADEPGAAESVVQFDSPSDADILKHAGAPAPAAADETSSVNLGGAPEPAAGGPASDLNLVHEALEPGLSEVNAGASPSDSGMLVELVDEEEQPAAGSAADLVEGLTGAGGPAGAAEGERPSGRDLIAEAVESGVDLAHAAEPAKAEEEPAIDLGHVTPTEDSSAVDLGASTPEVSSEEMAKAAAELRDLDLARLHEEPAAADSAVNLGAAGERAAGESGVEAVAAEAEEAAGAEAEAEHAAAAAALLGGAGEEEAAGERAGAAAEEDRFAGLGEEEAAEEPEAEAEAEAEAEEEAEAEAEAEEEAEAEAEEEEVAAGPKEKAAPAKRGGVGCLALGGVAGLFVGAAAVLALLVALPGVAGSILGPLGVKLQDKEPPRGPDLSAKQPTLQDARDHLRRGDLDRAWPTLESAGDQPEALAARGEARWLRYLQQHPVPKADDEEVKKAAEDLQKAGETDPDALFWLGHLQERTGNLAAAKATYEKGLKQFQNDVPQKRRFQAALDRLESRAALPAAGNLARDDARLLLVLLVTGLQPPGQPKDGQPKDGQPVPPGQPQPGQPQPGDAGQEEAGFEFWSAVKMAGKGDYANAIKELDKARQLHDKLRFTRLRKAQNPLSDPTEDIFLKSCDELKAYWQIRERLSRGKYLDLAQNRDPVKAI
ncbi:MAG TPA: hypothetical protein VFA26_04755, partial [Gemmataceae bacterium]|nr:hypothetical protein [Gemmataceae bacterium]